MENAVKLAFELNNRYEEETATPFVVTLHVERYRRYQLSGCNIPSEDIRVEVVYYDDNDDLQVECIGFIEDSGEVDSVDEAAAYLHKLLHDDLKVLRGCSEGSENA